MSESAGESTAVEELESQIELCEHRFDGVVEQIQAVLRADVRSHFAREARRAFIARPDQADALSDDRVRAFKAAAEAGGEAASATLQAALAERAHWTAPAEAPEDARSLEAATAVWAHITAVDGALAALLEEHGLGGATSPSYRPPRYFVGGLYLPALVEHYWKLRAELEGLRGEREATLRAAQSDRLGTRWDSL